VPAAAPLPGKGNFHVVVERGQTLDRIAQLYHVAKRDVIAANQLNPPYTLKPGTILAIPLSAVQSTGQSATKAAARASANRDRAASTLRRNASRPEPEVIELDDVPTHSLPLPKIWQ
jgi:LysM repeat protein